MCFSGRTRIEETMCKTWVGQLILIVVSINYSAISGNSPLSHHSFPLCKMGRVIENLNLGIWSPSTATNYICLLANIQLFSAGVTHPASSQEPGGLITCSFKDLWTHLGRGCLSSVSYYPVPEAPFIEIEYRDWAVCQRKFTKKVSLYILS